MNRGSTAGFVPPTVYMKKFVRASKGTPRKVFPGHALHGKGLLGHKGAVPLVGSQEQRALLVPVINR